VASIFSCDIPEGALVRLGEGVLRKHDSFCKGVGIVVKSYRFKESPLDYFVTDVAWADGQITRGILSATLNILEREEE
jgi:hypothetical protein